MTASQRFSPLARALIGGACFVIVLAGMRAAADLVNAFLLAMVITVSVSPFLHWLIRRGIPEKLAAAILIILVLAIVVVLLFTVFLSATQLVETFPEYGTRVEELKTDVERWLRARGIDLTETLTVEPLEPRQLVDAAIKALLYARDAVSGWALMILLVVFMLGEAANYPQKVFDAYASDSDALTRMSRLNTEIRQYMFITSWSGLLMAIANAVLLYALGVPFALLWGVLSFFLGYIPAIGFIIALIPPTLLALLHQGGREAHFVIVGYSVIKGIVFSVLRPMVAGRKLNLSRLAIIASVVLWVWVLGPIGAMLAVPVTMIVKDVLLESSEDGRVLALVMSADTGTSTAPSDESADESVA
jgi:AI-2 transport protein TqsA